VVLKVLNSLTHHAYKVNQIQRYEADAAKAIGISLFQLMERAGNAVLSQIQQHFSAATKFLIVCGKGNNGGDGYIVARLVHQASLAAIVMVNARRESITGDAQ
jgi:hydroxyethylthiazole kinase-like uncharacterized protein yjeF